MTGEDNEVFPPFLSSHLSLSLKYVLENSKRSLARALNELQGGRLAVHDRNSTT
jgi:hypothetical protein